MPTRSQPTRPSRSSGSGDASAAAGGWLVTDELETQAFALATMRRRTRPTSTRRRWSRTQGDPGAEEVARQLAEAAAARVPTSSESEGVSSPEPWSPPLSEDDTDTETAGEGAQRPLVRRRQKAVEATFTPMPPIAFSTLESPRWSTTLLTERGFRAAERVQPHTSSRLLQSHVPQRPWEPRPILDMPGGHRYHYGTSCKNLLCGRRG